MKTLKGAVVGAGYFSQFHLDAWSRIIEVELAAVCDIDIATAQVAADRFGVPGVYGDFCEMLNGEALDFVDIVTRPDSHLALTREAVSRSIAVICQKPLTPTLSESQELVATAEESGVPLMVHDNFRFQPWYREIKRLLDANSVGDRLHSITVRTRTGDGWQPDAYVARQPYFRTMPQFLIFETGVHFIDTFRFLAGEIDGVYASLRRLNPDIVGEDAGIVLFEFANGAHGMWDANRFNEADYDDTRYTFGETLVEGNAGSIRLSPDGRLTVQRLGEPAREHGYGPSTVGFAGDCAFATQQHFVNCLLRREPFETSGRSYLKTLHVQNAIYDSAAAGAPVRGLCSGEPSTCE